MAGRENLRRAELLERADLYDEIFDTDVKLEANLEVLDGKIVDRNNVHVDKIKNGINYLQNTMFTERERRIWGLKSPPKTKFATQPEFEHMTYRQIVAYKNQEAKGKKPGKKFLQYIGYQPRIEIMTDSQLETQKHLEEIVETIVEQIAKEELVTNSKIEHLENLKKQKANNPVALDSIKRIIMQEEKTFNDKVQTLMAMYQNNLRKMEGYLRPIDPRDEGRE